MRRDVNLIEKARQLAGYTQQDLADRAGTSRSTLSAYERNRKIPSLATTERLVRSAGFDLSLVPRAPESQTQPVLYRGRAIAVPQTLPDLPPHRAFRRVQLPHHLQWSGDPNYDLSDRKDRARVYEIVLREGALRDVLAYVDGKLLVDLWSELYLHPAIRGAWQSLVDGARIEPEAN